MKKAAELPTAKAEDQHRLGVLYSTGKATERILFGNMKERAQSWFTKAAQRGLADGQYALAEALKLGYTAKASPSSAIPWYRKAAEQKHPDAQYVLGHMFLYGAEGVAKNEKEAVTFLRELPIRMCS